MKIGKFDFDAAAMTLTAPFATIFPDQEVIPVALTVKRGGGFPDWEFAKTEVVRDEAGAMIRVDYFSVDEGMVAQLTFPETSGQAYDLAGFSVEDTKSGHREYVAMAGDLGLAPGYWPDAVRLRMEDGVIATFPLGGSSATNGTLNFVMYHNRERGNVIIYND